MASECDSVGTVTVAGPVTDDTLRTFANGRVAQHPVDPLGIGVGVPRLLVGRATGNQEAARASGVPHLTSQTTAPEGLVDDLPHRQVPLSDHFEIRSQGLACEGQAYCEG